MALIICCVLCCCLYYCHRTHKAARKIKQLRVTAPPPSQEKSDLNGNPKISTIPTFSSYTPNSNTLKLDQAIPNPANDECKIQFVTGKNMDIEFRLTNLLGEIVEVRQINASRGVNDILLNTSEFTNGVYLYSIKNGDNHLTKRLIINH